MIDFNNYKRLTEKTIGCFQYDLKDFNHKVAEFNDYDAFFAYSMAAKRLGELEDKIEDGTLVELPNKGIEELDIIKDGMIFVFYKMCLEQNLGQSVFLEYKSKINEWFKSYLKNKGLQEK